MMEHKHTNEELFEKLVVGAKIKIGKHYSGEYDFDEGEIITLVEGYFESFNGLYEESQTAPSIWDGNDYASIYHLFGDDLEHFKDCEVLTDKQQ